MSLLTKDSNSRKRDMSSVDLALDRRRVGQIARELADCGATDKWRPGTVGGARRDYGRLISE